MSNQTTESTRVMLLSLIEAEYESDAAFERALGLPEKTVNNWRRGRSASFMKMLPLLSERFRVQVGALMDMPLRGEVRSSRRRSCTFCISTADPAPCPPRCERHWRRPWRRPYASTFRAPRRSRRKRSAAQEKPRKNNLEEEKNDLNQHRHSL